MFKIKGKIKGKNYLSRKTFKTEQTALKYAYDKLIYTPKGNTKKKHQLTDFEIIKTKR